MNILHIYWDLKIGGIQTLLVQLANSQCVSHDVSVLILSERQETMAEKFDSRVTVRYLNKEKGSKVKLILACIKMNLFIFLRKFDIIHFHDPRLLRYVFPLFRKNCVGTYHRDKNFYRTKSFFCITSVSKHVHDCLKQSLDMESVVVENGIAVEKYNKKKNDEGIVFKIVQVGRLEHNQKGQDNTIRVLKSLKNAGYKVSLDLIGSGPSQEYLGKMVKQLKLDDDVRFLGLKDQTYLYDNLCNYDLLVQPSTFEAFGLTAIEGMAAKVPVVVSGVPALKSIVGNGRYGFFFENEKENDFFVVVKNIIENGLPKGMIDAAYDYVQSNYSVETMCQRYMKVYEEICSGNCN